MNSTGGGGAEDDDGPKTETDGRKDKPMVEKTETAVAAGIWLSELKPYYCLVILPTSRSYNTLQVTTLTVGSHHSVTSPTNLCLLATGKPDRRGKNQL